MTKPATKSKSVILHQEDGSILEGTCIIEGMRKMRQKIVYQDQIKIDSATYSPGEEKIMDAVAKQILYEFASGRVINKRSVTDR